MGSCTISEGFKAVRCGLRAVLRSPGLHRRLKGKALFMSVCVYVCVCVSLQILRGSGRCPPQVQFRIASRVVGLLEALPETHSSRNHAPSAVKLVFFLHLWIPRHKCRVSM